MPLLLAYVLDALVGDPHRLPHPVIFIGRLIAALEKRLLKTSAGKGVLLLRGAFLTVSVVTLTYLSAWLLLRAAALLHPWAAYALNVVLLATAIAARCLTEAADDVARPLLCGDLSGARQAVSLIVGRDTESMDGHGVARAAVETVAENTVDGVTAPLFYALIGGAPLALAYKAVNTLDSMVGYQNDRYRYFGRASARLDDAANWLPARLTVPVMLLAAFLLRFDGNSAVRALRRDGQKHPSPNSGLAEALTAGALGITLGGENRYGGLNSQRPQLWPEGRPAEAGDIGSAAKLMAVASVFFLVLGLLTKELLLIFFAKGGLT